MAGAPDLSYSQDHMSLEHKPELAPTSVTILIDQVLEFSDATNQPVVLTPGTYQISPTPSNQLQFISAGTEETSAVRAQTFHHTEPLSAPSTLLIQDEDAEERVHLLVFFPGGKGWDTEGSVGNPVRSRGEKFNALSWFSPKQGYTAVILQQGRVTTDADWNEQDAISPPEKLSPHSNLQRSYGQVTLDQGRVHLDTDARRALFRRCRMCFRTP